MLTIDRIMEILPYRFPFLFVDVVQELSEERIVAIKQISCNEPQFAGHFPGRPVMPGVLILEALAQAGALLAHYCGGYDPAKEQLMLMTIDGAKFRRPVRPGDRMTLEVVPLRKGRLWKLRGAARVDGEIVAEAVLVAAIQPSPSRGGGE